MYFIFIKQYISKWKRHLSGIYTCKDCGKMFHGTHSSRNYERHLNTHLPKKKPEKLHICLKCGKTFPFNSYLNRHMNRAHAGPYL